mmetsp:Transcript_6973/g.19666  ORF Transcript_6973/g.19666 Transcript_6973/m.19666 type:complete len:142 (+) Transcript_6973:286-711(+)
MAPPKAASRQANALLAQRALAFVFLGLGAPCMAAPSVMLGLSVRPEALSGSDAEWLMMACFGAQAVLQGFLLLACTFTRATFAAYGVAVLPFFAFNWYFSPLGPRPLLTDWMLLDFVGNAALLLLCWIGYSQLSGSDAKAQ